MSTIDPSKPVLVTGATGYVAGWIVKRLLQQGFTVHAPVRNPDSLESLRFLRGIEKETDGKILFFKADLLAEGSYDKAMEGCELVFHTASPFINSVKDPQKDLVDPALQGTRNVLGSVNRTPGVKRVVLTSSVAAIIGDSKDCLSYPNKVATEDQWNLTSTLMHQSYSYSKTVAEREAWKMNAEQSRWDLVVVNPSLVIGPGINPKSTSESFNLIHQLGDGSMRMGVPRFFIGLVDVRDLADAHLLIALNPESKGRHIISAEESSFWTITQILMDRYCDKYPFPKRELPKWMVWLAAPSVGFTRKWVSTNVGYHFSVDNSKSLKMGVKYRPIETSVIDFFQQMIDHGLI